MSLELKRFAAVAVLVPALLLGACERGPVGREAAPPPRELRMVLPGFTVKALPWNEWKTEQGNRDRMVVSKAQGKSLMRLRVEEFVLEVPAESVSFMQEAEAREQRSMAKLEKLSAHYDITRIDGAECLRYDGIYRDAGKAGTADEFLNRRGYVCQHPSRPDTAARLDFSVRSPTREPDGLEGMLQQADGVFETLEFKPAG